MAAALPAGGGSHRPLNPVVTLHEEAVCAICLDYFIDPVSIGCGHNFCRVCITQLWGSGEGEEEGEDAGASGSDGDYGPGTEGAVDDGGIDDLGPEEDGDDDEDDLEGDEYLDDGDMEEDEEEDASRDEDEDDEDEVWDDEDDREYWDQDPGEDEMWEDAMGGDLFFDNYDDEEVMDEEEEPEEEAAYTVPSTSPSPPQRQAFTCPQCRKKFSHRNFRPNLQLANMVQIIRQIHPQPVKATTSSPESVELAAAGDSSGAPSLLGGEDQAPRDEQALCEKHQEPLKLFCEVDEEPICVVCRESRSHKHHSVMPLEEVVQEYKAKLHGHLDPLRKKLETVQKQKLSEEEKIAELKNKLKLDMKEFESDFERMHQFLIGEQALLLHQLEDRYELLLARQSGNVSRLEEQGAALSRLIAEAEDKSKQDGLQLLKDFKATLIRCENIQFQDPEIMTVDAGKKCQNYFLIDVLMRKMEKVFGKIIPANLTLDPDTAHPRLNLSSDCCSVRLGDRWRDLPDNPKRFDSDFCVLALQGFSSGRHYWEVEVGGRWGWAVGAARESARRKQKSSGGPHQKREIWCVGTNGKKYQALTTTEQTSLSPVEKLRRFCVYLDYERGQLGFYNAENMAHLHTFNASFRERIFPFFRILSKGTRIKICN